MALRLKAVLALLHLAKARYSLKINKNIEHSSIQTKQSAAV